MILRHFGFKGGFFATQQKTLKSLSQFIFLVTLPKHMAIIEVQFALLKTR